MKSVTESYSRDIDSNLCKHQDLSSNFSRHSSDGTQSDFKDERLTNTKKTQHFKALNSCILTQCNFVF